MNDVASDEVSLRRLLVGVHLKKWRETSRLSQVEVARKLKYSSPQFISNWERGLSLPPMDVLPKIMHIYGLSAEHVTEVIYKYQEEHLAMQRTEMVRLLKYASKH